jgi:hypothetical protein
MLERSGGVDSSTSSLTNHDQRNAFLCGLLVAFAVLISLPFAELGRNDDWSYARSALDLARTGKLVYNGWSTAILGAQAFWGAGIIKLFGFSFTSLRLSVLPFACCSGSLLYLLSRRVGASASISMLAALTIGLSQLAIECAATFSTDIPALFCFTFALHQFARSLDQTRRSTIQIIIPLLLAATAGYAGGSIRQVYWLMPLVGFAYVAWARRRERATAAIALALLIAVVIAMLATEAWSHAQPYFIAEFFHAMMAVFAEQFPWSLLPVVPLVMTLTLFALPMIIGCWTALKRGGSSVTQVAGVLLAVAAIWGMGDRALAPWLGNLVTQYGIFNRGQDAIGDQPQIIPDLIRLLLTLVCAAAASRVVWAFVRSAARLVKITATGGLPDVLCLGSLFAIAYTALILFRAPAFLIIDRYTLPLTAIICLWLSWATGRSGIMRPTLAGWSLLIIVAFFGIAVTHDEFAVARARLRAAAALSDRGIARTAITAGVDFDAWTQVQQAGFVNESRILNPPNAFVPHPRSVPAGRTDYWFWEWSPTVRPDYSCNRTP